MNIEDFRDYCLTLKGTTESFPFDSQTLVMKVGGKMYALADVEQFNGFSVKCDPEEAVELREKYPAVKPGYHLNKKHWNSVAADHSIPDELMFQWIRNSYDLVFKGLPKSIRETI